MKPKLRTVSRLGIAALVLLSAMPCNCRMPAETEPEDTTSPVDMSAVWIETGAYHTVGLLMVDKRIIKYRIPIL